MAKKFTGIYLDPKTNKYYVSTTFITKDNYQVKKCKRGFETQKDAELWKQEQKLYYAKIYYTTEENRKTEIAKLLDDYIKYLKIRLKPTTINSKKSILENYFVKYFEHKRLDEITPTIIQNYYQSLCDKGLKTSSINNVITDILLFIEWLDLMELIDNSISKKFKRILVKQTMKETYHSDYLEQEDLKKLLSVVDESESSGKQQKIFYLVCAYAGLRLGEALAIQYSDIDFDNNTIKVNKQVQYINGISKVVPYTKTNNIKSVDTPEFLTKYIYDYKQLILANDNDFILDKSREFYRKQLDLDLQKAGLKHIRIHDLRHSYCTMLYDMGADEKYVAKQLGHKSSNTSKNTYEHLTETKNQKNIDNVISKISIK